MDLVDALHEFEVMRASYLHTLRVTIEQLVELPPALSRDTPKIEASVAVLEEVIKDLKKKLGGVE